ncbi:hypothetical protein OQA88_10613 [Cercophora sp. LCS_1]
MPENRGRASGTFRPGGPAPIRVFFQQDGTVPPPDAVVNRAENTLQAGKDALRERELLLERSFPHRPGYGTAGKPVTLWANYVEMAVSPDLKLHRYAISVSPSVVGRKLTQVIRILLQAPELGQFQHDIVSDFRSTLLSRQKFVEDDLSVTICYREEGHDEPEKGAREYNVRLCYTGTLSVAELTEYLTSTDLRAHYDDKLPMIQALNIFLNHYSKSTGNLVTISSSKTFSLNQSSATFDLGSGLIAIRGFFASVRTACCRVLVNVNVSTAAFYQDGPLDNLILRLDAELTNKSGIEAFLNRLRVRTTYLPERRNQKGEVIHREKTILGLATTDDGQELDHPPRVKEFGAGPMHVEFWLEGPAQTGLSTAEAPNRGKRKKASATTGLRGDSASSASGRYISVYDYFWETYGLSIDNTDIPVVNVGTRGRPTYLPPEFCFIFAGQNATSKLNHAQIQKMAQFAARKPWENATSIISDGLGTVGLDSRTNALLHQFGLSVSPGLITVPGRVLPPPKVVYSRNKEAQVRFGGWNMVDAKFNTAGSLKRWSYLMISLRGCHDAFEQASLADVIRRFGGALSRTGISVMPPRQGQTLILNGPDDPQLDQRLKLAAQHLDFLLIILPEHNTPMYNRIKRCCDQEFGIQTICVVGHKLAKERGQDHFFANIALKLNLKLGGNNQLVDKARLGIISENKTMVVGIDVTHPSPASSKDAPSIAGMVASIDRSLGQWPGVLRVQAARQEMVSGLTDMLKSRLRLWKSLGKHQTLPENILVYRDGVSEGQYQTVVDEELPLLRKACEDMYPAVDQSRGVPRLTVILVGKRHHTRFYPTHTADADQSSNPKPGTVIDRGVTDPRSWEFFLQSHAAIQGTARPARYVVVLDEIFRAHCKRDMLPSQMAADRLQGLTLSMCYAYGRATKAVSICTPAYYATLLCERSRCYLSGVFDPYPGSASPSISGNMEGIAVIDEEVRIHPRIRDSMFYI